MVNRKDVEEKLADVGKKIKELREKTKGEKRKKCPK